MDLFASVQNEAAVSRTCPKLSHGGGCRATLVQNEAMPSIVSPEGINYVITDVKADGPDLAALKGRRSDLPPLKNGIRTRVRAAVGPLFQCYTYHGLFGSASQNTYISCLGHDDASSVSFPTRRSRTSA